MKKNKGFTLIELMIALVISSFVLLGLTGTYSSIHASIQVSKELENAQEVIRYSSHVFTRSLKQTIEPPSIVGNKLTVKQKLNARSCIGSVPTVNYEEIFTFIEPNLSCRIQNMSGVEIAPDRVILTGIKTLTTVPNGNLFSITVKPTVLPKNFGVGAGAGVRIDIALTSVILKDAMPES